MTYTSVMPGVKEVVTGNPENLQHILKTNFANYPKGPSFQVHRSIKVTSDAVRYSTRYIVSGTVTHAGGLPRPPGHGIFKGDRDVCCTDSDTPRGAIVTLCLIVAL